MFCHILCSFFDALLRIVADLLIDANENVEVEEVAIVIGKYLGEPIMKYF
jgi:hypothetical protein